MGKAPNSFSRECCEMGMLGIISHKLVPVSVYYGVPWHQFGRMMRHHFLSIQTDTGPERDAVQGMVVD
jgi:hypothetical protein